ncbi:plasmid pRiA4b ORF-3 family protein [Photorhabdus kleinii]|uniref:plasmid pRiA4b ORF-3 family protein n=1 Tax=Photorhabdus kleinii TaxID=768034 RepID=UPI0021D4A9AC|nr:plasmid pRiA4b ORF-3 family protein [Photorhabdus kleinii]MCT8344137.1 plasmid pRiA4b ORF-3 family protein [Photorhabdus kleinii]
MLPADDRILTLFHYVSIIRFAMKMYTIKLAVRGVSPMVWRRLRIATDTSLAALHYIIQIVQGWDDDHLHQFHIYGKDYGISYEGGIAFPDNPYKVVIDDFAFDVGDRFAYQFNLFDNWLHDIRIETIHDNSDLKTPFCLSGHGMPGGRHGLMKWTKSWHYFVRLRMTRPRSVIFVPLLMHSIPSGSTDKKSISG